jgi:hypothetical protein
MQVGLLTTFKSPITTVMLTLASVVPDSERLEPSFGGRWYGEAERIRKRRRSPFCLVKDSFYSSSISSTTHLKSGARSDQCRLKLSGRIGKKYHLFNIVVLAKVPQQFGEELFVSETTGRGGVPSSPDQRQRTASGAERQPGSRSHLAHSDSGPRHWPAVDLLLVSSCVSPCDCVRSPMHQYYFFTNISIIPNWCESYRSGRRYFWLRRIRVIRVFSLSRKE